MMYRRKRWDSRVTRMVVYNKEKEKEKRERREGSEKTNRNDDYVLKTELKIRNKDKGNAYCRIGLDNEYSKRRDKNKLNSKVPVRKGGKTSVSQLTMQNR